MVVPNKDRIRRNHIQECQCTVKRSAVRLAPSDVNAKHHRVDLLRIVRDGQVRRAGVGGAAPRSIRHNRSLDVALSKRLQHGRRLESTLARSKIGFKNAPLSLRAPSSSGDSYRPNNSRSRSSRGRTRNLAAPYSVVPHLRTAPLRREHDPPANPVPQRSAANTGEGHVETRLMCGRRPTCFRGQKNCPDRHVVPQAA